MGREFCDLVINWSVVSNSLQDDYVWPYGEQYDITNPRPKFLLILPVLTERDISISM